MLRSLVITAAKDGGYYVRDANCFTVEQHGYHSAYSGPTMLLAGTLTECLEYVREQMVVARETSR